MRLLFTILLCISSIVKAQESSFVYELKYKSDPNSSKQDNITFYLDIKNQQSLFRSVSFRKSDSLRVKRGYGNGYDMAYNNKQLYIKKDNTLHEIKKYVFVPLVFSTYTISIDDKLDWKISDEKQKIGNYNCQKANVEYGGRSWTAWFTTDIPFQNGPYVFGGLPGLIVNISDDRSDYIFSLTQIKKFMWKELYPEKSLKEISWDEFRDLQKSFYNDPLAMIDKKNITSFDDAGNEVKTDVKEMRESAQKRISKNNNPVELNHKVEYK